MEMGLVMADEKTVGGWVGAGLTGLRQGYGEGMGAEPWEDPVCGDVMIRGHGHPKG